MGRRHLHGLAVLEQAGMNPFALAAVCDPFVEAGQAAADLAEEVLGNQPAVYANLAEMSAEIQLDAADIVTMPSTHHTVAAEALQLGINVQVEKPVALTIRAADLLERVADATGLVCSVAENFRRDPLNRLVRSVVDSGVLGRPLMMVDTTLSGGGTVLITPWRSTQAEGGLLMDVGVHNADMFGYFMGPLDSVTGWAGVLEPQRHWGGQVGNLARYYQLSNRGVAGTYDADGVDSGFALLRFNSGAGGHWSQALGVGGGDHFRYRRIYLEGGMIECPDDRSGQPANVTVRDGRSQLTGDEVLDLVPNFRLDVPTAALFGGDRLGHVDLGFDAIDRRIMASEYWELGNCIENDLLPEVTVAEGRGALATVLGVIESSLAGRTVTMAEILAGGPSIYQDGIDAQLANTI